MIYTIHFFKKTNIRHTKKRENVTYILKNKTNKVVNRNQLGDSLDVGVSRQGL